MAETTLTRNLRLRITPDLTADARYNIGRLDLLGGVISTDTTENTTIRSAGDMTIETESPRLGGEGAGGTLLLQTDITRLTGLLQLPDTSTDFHLGLRFNSNAAALADRLLTLDIGNTDRTVQLLGDLTLAAGFSTVGGHSVQLTTTGPTALTLPTTGTLATLADLAGLNGDVNQYSTDWIVADGATKVVTHGLGVADVLLSIRDETNNIIGVNASVIDSNNVQLESSEVPTGTWRVTIHA